MLPSVYNRSSCPLELHAAPFAIRQYPQNVHELTEEDLPGLLPNSAIAKLQGALLVTLSSPPDETECLSDFVAFQNVSAHGMASKRLSELRLQFHVSDSSCGSKKSWRDSVFYCVPGVHCCRAT